MITNTLKDLTENLDKRPVGMNRLGLLNELNVFPTLKWMKKRTQVFLSFFFSASDILRCLKC